MSYSTRSVTALLLLLSGAGFYLTLYLIVNNGTAALLQPAKLNGVPVLPGTKFPLKLAYTGISAVDGQLVKLALFFWPVIDGSVPSASMQGLHFGGQIVAAWGLMLVEGMRFGNRGRLVSNIAVLGVIVQNIPFGATLPAFLALHLATSSLTLPNKATIQAPAAELYSIPISLILGFLVPSIAMALPAPSILSPVTKQNLLALWQFFPIWVSAFQQVFKRLIASSQPAPTRTQKTHTMRPLRCVYGFLLLTAAWTHIATLSLTATTLSLPDIFNSKFVGALHPFKVFVPAAMSPLIKISEHGAGNLLLLQWDEIVGTAALVVWASLLYSKSYTQRTNWLQLIIGNLANVAIFGPAGAAVALMWGRDERVFTDRNENVKKIT